MPHPEDGTLVYCEHCGAPQIRLSEELREQAEEQRHAAAQAAGQASGPGVSADPQAVVWRTAIRHAFFASAAIALVCVILQPLLLLAWGWAALLPFGVAALYAAQHPTTRWSTGLGARFGLLCGVFSSVSLAVVTVGEMAVLRFGLHAGGTFDATMQERMSLLRAQATAQGAVGTDDLFRLMAVPEFRAGFFLGGLGMCLTVLVLAAVCGGALAGTLRSRRAV